MGICETNNHNLKNREGISIFPDNQNTSMYKFECQSKNILTKKTYNIEFIFSQIKIKHCISHSPNKNSTYITQVSIGQSKFKLIINKNKTPIIDSKNIFKISKEFTLKELESTLLYIYVYEFTDEIDINILNQMNELPKEYISICNYKSAFNMDLFSFLFKSKKCDFLMKNMEGANGLSSNTRICFNCDIIHKEKIKIYVKDSTRKFNLTKLIFKSNNSNIINTSKNPIFYDFKLSIPLISMNELQKSDLFLETNENIIPYKYITLNDIKHIIFKKLGKKIIKQENDYQTLNISNSISLNNSINNQDKRYSEGLKGNGLEIFDSISENKKDATLNFENLPLITQTSSLFFTEVGYLYNTTFLHIINNDKELHTYRNNSKISCENFYVNLKNIYDDLSEGNFEFKNLFDELGNILRRSIDAEKFYFLYPDIESLNKMIILMMCIGIKIIEYVQIIKEEEKLIILLKAINNLLKREELDNAVIYMCLKHVQTQEESLKNINNDFFIKLFKLNEYCKLKKIPSLNPILIDIYTKLYFKKKYIRETIFNTLNKDKEYKNNLMDVFIYDIVNDDKINRYLDQNEFNQILQKKGLFTNLFSCGILFFKNIISYLNNSKINEFPFDFTQFNDNLEILNLLGKYVKNKKLDNLENEFYELPALLSNSYDSINMINNSLIKNTNGYNDQALFKLFDYFKSLLEYYYTKDDCKLIMDYTLLEEAINIIIKIDNSISLPKLFWFYYSCSHLILSGNLKCFIIDVCNQYFNNFAYHWSFGVRQVFFKLILFIYNDKLKNEEGKLFNVKNINNFEKKIVDKNNIYNVESLKDYESMNKEYKEWMESYQNNNTTEKEYPVLFVPLPINPDKID